MFLYLKFETNAKAMRALEIVRHLVSIIHSDRQIAFFTEGGLDTATKAESLIGIGPVDIVNAFIDPVFISIGGTKH